MFTVPLQVRLIRAVLCLQVALWLQLFVSAGHRWLHNTQWLPWISSLAEKKMVHVVQWTWAPELLRAPSGQHKKSGKKVIGLLVDYVE